MQDRLKKVLAEPWSRRLLTDLEALDRASRPPRRCACRCEVSDAVAEVNVLVTAGLARSAAVLYAFGCRPHAFPGAHHAMTGLLLFEAMLGQALVFEGTVQELAVCLGRLRRGTMTEEGVGAWLAARSRSRGAVERPLLAAVRGRRRRAPRAIARVAAG